jgi:O-antigen/teichoic acid export membrane protein
VVAFYSAELQTRVGTDSAVGAFFRRSWRWAWQWGLVALALSALLAPWLARLLQIESPRPLWAASLALLLLFLRPVTDGVLQGIQHFWGLATVQFSQAVLRLIFAAVLIQAGLQAFGAVLALPLATTSACLLALWWLRPQRRAVATAIETPPVVSRRYSSVTLVGMLSFALLVNMDAILVKALFSPLAAGNYSAVVTLGKINLFIPLALGMVLFPKAVERQVAGRDPRPLLLLALAAALAAGAVVTVLYFAVPNVLVTTIFGAEYSDPGVLLGLIGLATTLYAALNIWLNYALSLQRSPFVIALALIVVAQAAGIWLWHGALVNVALVMVAGGVAGNLAGLLTLFGRNHAHA